MTAALITTMLVVANVMGAGMAYPQAARLIRERSTAGISVSMVVFELGTIWPMRK